MSRVRGYAQMVRAVPIRSRVGAAGDLPFVGRDEELAFAASALADHGIVLGGAAGVGKTRLAREAIRALGDEFVAWTAATPGAGDIPFGGLAGLGLDEDPGAFDGRPSLLARLTRSLLDRAAGRRVVLAVDDAHLLDDLAAAFVHQLVTGGKAAVLLTVRSTETPPPALVALYKDGLVPRLELQPLGRDEFAALVVGALGGAIEAETLARLWEATDGNVLYLHELVADALDNGSLADTGSGWRWARTGRVGPRLVELVAERMGRLDEPSRHMVELLAVGEPIGAQLLESLVPEADLVHACHRGLLTIEESRQRVEVRLGHPLFGEVVRAEMSILQRRRAERQLADVLERAGLRRNGDVLRAAVWRMSSASATDATLLADGARRAQRNCDPDLAARLARASLALAPSFDTSLTLAAALDDLGCYDAATEVLSSLSDDESDDEHRLALAVQRVWSAFQSAGLEHARHILAAAEAAITDPVGKQLLRARLALPLAIAGQWRETLDVAGPLVADGVDDRVRLRAVSGVAGSLTMLGRGEEAVALCDELEPVAEHWREDQPRAVTAVTSARVSALITLGRLPEVVEVLSPLNEPDATSKLPPADVAHGKMKLGKVLLMQGRPRTALRTLADAVPVLRDNDIYRSLALCLALMAEANALLGDLDAAHRLAADARATRSSSTSYEGDVARALAWTAVVEGERSRAITELLDAVDDQLEHQQPVFAAWALHDALRLGGREAAARLAELAGALSGPWPAAATRHAVAVLSGEPQDHEDAASSFAVIDAHLVAAELASAAAAGWSRRALRARETAARRSAGAHLRRCEIASSPSALAAAGSEPLTRREQEIADLAGHGLSSPEIARQLAISVRTVESHLYAVYAKLGITSRRELT